MKFLSVPPLGNITMRINESGAGEIYPDFPGPCCPMPQLGKLLILVEQMKMYLFPCLLAFGIPFNLISVVLFMKSRLRKITTVHYFIACGITDSIQLCATLIPWLEVYDIWLYSMEGICQIVVYLRHLSEFLSSWYLTLALLDNLIGTMCALSPKRYCTVFKTRALILAVFMLALVALLYLTWTYGPLRISGYSKDICEVIEQARDAMVVLSVMRIIFASLIPGLSVLVLVILLCAYCGRCRSNSLHDVNRRNILIPLQSNRTGQSKSAARLKINRQCLTAMCLVLGSSFMLIAIPKSVIILRVTFLKYQSHGPPPMELVGLQQLLSELYNILFAWKFFIYFVFLKQFRNRLCKCFLTKPKPEEGENMECVVDGDEV